MNVKSFFKYEWFVNSERFSVLEGLSIRNGCAPEKSGKFVYPERCAPEKSGKFVHPE